MRKHGTSGSSLPISDSPTSQATSSAAPVNGAPSKEASATRPPKPKQLVVACVLAAMPPQGHTALILTFANPEQLILGINADPYLAALQERLEKLTPVLSSLDKLDLLVAGGVVDVDAVANKLNDALQLVEVLETAPLDTPVSFDETWDQVHELVVDALKILRPRGAPTIVGKELLGAIGAQLDHEARVQADGGV